MATLQAQRLLLRSTSFSFGSASRQRPSAVHARVGIPDSAFPEERNLPALMMKAYELRIRDHDLVSPDHGEHFRGVEKEKLIAELYVLADAVADRVEMHSIIGKQRDNWAHLFPNSINSLCLAASLMAGISSMQVGYASLHTPSLKLSSMILFAGAGMMMAIANATQPSQLAEEQRKATQLWKQLGREIQRIISEKNQQTSAEVEDIMEKVLALDKAYPLPLLPGMIKKFPETFVPACWWPKKQRRIIKHQQVAGDKNGWTEELEEEMKGVVKTLKAKDEQEFDKLGKIALGINKSFAVSGPLFASLAAVATGFIGSGMHEGSIAVVLGVVGGAVAAVANSMEHGGQVGMVFEMYRNCAGYYKKVREDIEDNLNEADVGRRENGKVLEMKVALQLGRSISQLKSLTEHASPACEPNDIKDLAGKLF